MEAHTPPLSLKMVATKAGAVSSAGTGAALTNLIRPINSECCMCGDYGLSQELFRCKICKSRFQHKYCSNQYPKAELYKACNWCLTQTHNSGNSSNSSSSLKHSSGDGRRDRFKNKRSPNDRTGGRDLREIAGMIKKLHGSGSSPVSTGRKKVAGEKMLRKSKSANHLTNGGNVL